ncbi:MAG: hypothetical protein M3N54_12345, partial [Acidobacteriota bacterium]|nr:hypothetical protein [Acidobacteriota bacterium]
VEGQVSRLIPVSRVRRASAILGGDFTPLHQAEVTFSSVTLPDGRKIPLTTIATTGLDTIYTGVKARATVPPKSGKVAAAKTVAIDRIKDRMDSVAAQVRAPDKGEKLQEFLLAKLPWHPQWVRKGTRFDADLAEPAAFGTETIPGGDLRALGQQPASDSVVHTRLLTPVTSLDATVGQKVQAMISQPLLGERDQLVFPEGTMLSGTVTLSRHARWFHRGGQLRFAFDTVDLPEGMPRAEITVSAVLQSAEAAGTIPVKVDGEGGAKAVESKTRLIAPVLAGMIAARTMDNDRDRDAGAGAQGNSRGGTLGGASGFGLLGSLAAQSSRTVGRVFAFYGLAWQVYSAVIARGGEVEYRKDAAMDIRFGSRQAAPKK